MGSRLPIALATLILLCLGPSESLADRAMARLLVEEGAQFQQDGDLDHALDRYESAILSDPDYHKAYRQALPLWLRADHLAKAQRQLESLTLRCDDCVFAWYGLGAIYRKQKRFELAEMAYEVYLNKRPGDADALYGLAIALAALRKDSAKEALQRYLRIENRSNRRVYRERAQTLLLKMGGSEKIQSRVVSELLVGAALARSKGDWGAFVLLRTVAYLFSPGGVPPSLLQI